MHLPRVLVVDDELDVRQIYCRALTSRGFPALAVASAEEVQAAIGAFHPDLILLDIALPGISGLALFKALRADPRTRQLPVLLMTGVTNHKDLLEGAARDVDAESILTKPLDFSDLIFRIQKTLRAGPYRLDPVAKKIWIKDRELPHLTSMHFRFLRALLQTPEPLSAHDLLHAVWSDSENPNVVHVTACHLRRILRARPDIRLERSANCYRVTIS